MKNLLENIYSTYRNSTALFRKKPDFLIIGGQRCGTTSLFNYMLSHPQIMKGRGKEAHFFDLNFSENLNQYRAFFPLAYHDKLTGEASPYYIFHPLVPERVYRLLPNIKLIALLRNPVDRAYSHYQHEVRKGRENLTFSDAIEKESERLAEEEYKIIEKQKYVSFAHRNFSYLARGRYAQQLKKWYSYFNRNQLLELKSEDFFNKPQKELDKVFEFLEVKPYKIKNFKRYNYKKDEYEKMAEKIKNELYSYFEPHNKKLYELTERNFNWENKFNER